MVVLHILWCPDLIRLTTRHSSPEVMAFAWREGRGRSFVGCLGAFARRVDDRTASPLSSLPDPVSNKSKGKGEIQ